MNRRSFIQTLVGAGAGTTVPALLPAPAPAPNSTLAEEHEAWLAQIEEDNREVWRQTLKCFLEAGGPAIRWCCLDPVQDGYRVATIHLRDDETKVFRWKQPWITTSLPHRRWFALFGLGERPLPTKIK